MRREVLPLVVIMTVLIVGGDGPEAVDGQQVPEVLVLIDGFNVTGSFTKVEVQEKTRSTREPYRSV